MNCEGGSSKEPGKFKVYSMSWQKVKKNNTPEVSLRFSLIPPNPPRLMQSGREYSHNYEYLRYNRFYLRTGGRLLAKGRGVKYVYSL